MRTADRLSVAPKLFPGPSDRIPPLPPILDPAIARLITEHPGKLHALVEMYGSPLHLVWPERVTDNAAAMRGTLERHGVRHRIFYGAKANKSQALVAGAVAAGCGVDVSSLPEFEDAVRAGAGPERICATGPAKTRAFLGVLIAAGALIAIDSLEELADIEAIAGEARDIRILLRYQPRSAARSRFGMGTPQLMAAIECVATAGSLFRFEGFHVHLGGYDPETRVRAFRELLPLIEFARLRGLQPETIDMGGGLPVRYVESEAYEAALTAQKPHHYHNNRSPAGLYPYGGTQSAADWIEAFLSGHVIVGRTVADVLNAQGLTLALEPGRSLVDQAAISLFRVTRVKLLGDGDRVVFVEGASFSACETWFSSEFLIDPILVRQNPETSGGPMGAPVRAFIAGHSCLEEDVLTHRLIDFAAEPQPGDLLISANTAGYQMDLLENQFHRHPLPRRIAVTTAPDGSFQFATDL